MSRVIKTSGKGKQPQMPQGKKPSNASILNSRIQDWPKGRFAFPNELKLIGDDIYENVRLQRSHKTRESRYYRQLFHSFGMTSSLKKKKVNSAWNKVTKELNRLSGPVVVPYVKPVLQRFNGYVVDKSVGKVFRRRVHKTSGNHPRSEVTLTPIMRFPQMSDFVLAKAWNTVCGGTYPPVGNNGIHTALKRMGFVRV